MEERFDRIEKRFDDLFANLTVKFNVIDQRFIRIDGRFENIEKNISDLIEIVAGVMDYMTTKLATKEELAEAEACLETKLFQTEERLNGKIEGVQRSVDAAYELHGALEGRVTKLEATR